MRHSWTICSEWWELHGICATSGRHIRVALASNMLRDLLEAVSLWLILWMPYFCFETEFVSTVNCQKASPFVFFSTTFSPLDSRNCFCVKRRLPQLHFVFPKLCWPLVKPWKNELLLRHFRPHFGIFELEFVAVRFGGALRVETLLHPLIGNACLLRWWSAH